MVDMVYVGTGICKKERKKIHKNQPYTLKKVISKLLNACSEILKTDKYFFVRVSTNFLSIWQTPHHTGGVIVDHVLQFSP